MVAEYSVHGGELRPLYLNAVINHITQPPDLEHDDTSCLKLLFSPFNRSSKSVKRWPCRYMVLIQAFTPSGNALSSVAERLICRLRHSVRLRKALVEEGMRGIVGLMLGRRDCLSQMVLQWGFIRQHDTCSPPLQRTPSQCVLTTSQYYTDG